jgi:hypothetical protein
MDFIQRVMPGYIDTHATGTKPIQKQKSYHNNH